MIHKCHKNAFITACDQTWSPSLMPRCTFISISVYTNAVAGNIAFTCCMVASTIYSQVHPYFQSWPSIFLLYFISYSGKKKWTFKTSGHCQSPVLLSLVAVCFTSSRKKLFRSALSLKHHSFFLPWKPELAEEAVWQTSSNNLMWEGQHMFIFNVWALSCIVNPTLSKSPTFVFCLYSLLQSSSMKYQL